MKKPDSDPKWPPTQNEIIERNVIAIAQQIPKDHADLLANIAANGWMHQSVEGIAFNASIEIKLCRRMLKNLRQEGLLVLHWFQREDENLLAGSGYEVSHMGQYVLTELRKMKVNP